MYLGQVLFQNYMWPTLEIRVPRKAASTNTTASMLLNVVMGFMFSSLTVK